MQIKSDPNEFKGLANILAEENNSSNDEDEDEFGEF